jgi:MoxR-like ATPase
MPNEKETDGNNLEFTPGLVLNRFKSRMSNSQRNEALVIDELNRADIDKAFGQLFTVLSGQSVRLPYTKDGREVELAPFDGRTFCDSHEYRVPDSWSLIATLNTYDKTSLYEMSYAFMRRFSFIRVPAPTLEGLDDAALRALLLEYTDQDVWDIRSGSFGVGGDIDPLRDVGYVWRASNSAIQDRSIGPAVVKDMLEYLS